MAQASSYSGNSSDWTPSLGISICHGCGPKKKAKKKKIHLIIQISGPHHKLPKSLQNVLQVILMCHLVENHRMPQNPECLPGLAWPTPSCGNRVTGQSIRAHWAVSGEDVVQLVFGSP